MPLAADVEVPSPHAIKVETIVPSGSEDPAVDAVTVSGVVPLVGVTASFATGGWFVVVLVLTVTVCEAEFVSPPLSVTVPVTV